MVDLCESAHLNTWAALQLATCHLHLEGVLRRLKLQTNDPLALERLLKDVAHTYRILLLQSEKVTRRRSDQLLAFGVEGRGPGAAGLIEQMELEEVAYLRRAGHRAAFVTGELIAIRRLNLLPATLQRRTRDVPEAHMRATRTAAHEVHTSKK